MKKKIALVDMDGVLVNFETGIQKQTPEILEEYEDRFDEIPGIFGGMLPMDNAIESYEWLCEHFDTYIVSTAPWGNNSAWNDKHTWVRKYLGEVARKRLCLTHHKNMVMGDFLIDDRKKNGVELFTGEHIWFGQEPYTDWTTVIDYMKTKI